jgi:uncharacterized protein (TIGR02145 family)
VVVQVQDNTAPYLYVYSQDIVVDCSASESDIFNSVYFETFDDCSDVTVSMEVVPQYDECGLLSGGSYVLVTATDACGNETQDQVEVWTVDVEAPVLLESPIENGQTIYTNCSLDVPEPLDLVAVDNCSEVTDSFSESITIVDGEFGGWEWVERSYTFYDCSGNSTQFSYDIWVGDVNPPDLQVSLAETTIGCGDQVPFPSYTATDDCGTPDVSFSLSYNGDPDDCSTTTVATWTITATDGNGNQSVESVDVTILGNPGFACGDPLSYQGYDYATVLIGEQCWFAENLRSENYENGDAIPSNLSDSEWSSTTSGATAVYGEDAGCNNYSPDIDACDPAQSLNEYGRLYNWYAVDDSRGLCPSGWYVPTDENWMTMEMALGMTPSEVGNTGYRGTDQGTQMKTTYGWYNGGNGTNSSGFSGLPGGGRDFNGIFFNAGYLGYWWSSSPNSSYAWFRGLSYYDENVYRSYIYLRDGFSIRCVRDAE